MLHCRQHKCFAPAAKKRQDSWACLTASAVRQVQYSSCCSTLLRHILEEPWKVVHLPPRWKLLTLTVKEPLTHSPRTINLASCLHHNRNPQCALETLLVGAWARYGLQGPFTSVHKV